MTSQQKSYIFAGATILCWVTVPTAFKIALRYQDNFQLLLTASLVSTLIFGLVIAGSGKWKDLFKLRLKEYLLSALLGFLNPFLYYLVLFKAYSILPGQVAQPLNMIWPIVLVLISIPLLKQKISLRSILAMIISFSGIFFISSQGGKDNFRPEQLPGVLLALGSSVLWSFFWILNLKDKKDEALKLFLNFFFGLIFLFISMPLLNEKFAVSREALIGGVYVGIFEMGLAYIFWMKALQLSSSTDKISNLIYISPFLSLFFIHYIAGEKIYFTTLIGLTLVVTGILFQKIKAKG
ncbi:MAG: DMT family transporter [Bacteroidales bacterium]|nr:DMT family transporter [Bacteroidales bacterium]MCB8998635.1 DMT family transporter [Bacteroidales bacterium]MCB9012497.1 DMT family transporter [Bacteroidales bacterium]